MPPASPGHKLGQMIGNLFQDLFLETLANFANEHNLYCDKKGKRSAVRGNRVKVTWSDEYGNSHDLDYVLEENGTKEQQGDPVAFIELAWRRYTKHSRNKTGEIEGALLPLRETYPSSCRFLGAILAGEYSRGGIRQLESHGITVLHVPFSQVVQAFQLKDVDLAYPEKAPSSIKQNLINQWEQLSQGDLREIRSALKTNIQPELDRFMSELENSVLRRIESVRILSLFGEEFRYTCIEESIVALSKYVPSSSKVTHIGFEVYIRFSNGSKVEGRFQTKGETIQFLKLYK
jgi:hypothetical protein